MASKSYDRVVVKDHGGNPTVKWDRPVFGDLVVKTEGGRTVIERTGWFGGTTTYMPSEGESVEAES